MEGVKLGRNSGSTSGCNSSSSMSSQSEEEMMMNMELRRGPWTVEEDLTLINYIANHGEGRWNSLARCAGLKRTGKSCRLRWLNYLRPDVRRGNITLEEQLLILELHSRWGNRWSKIAQHLPGRTDNEIKNYWRTRVQKHAKQLKCDVNSKQFKDTMRYLWMPRLVERIHAHASSASSASASAANTNANNQNMIAIDEHHGRFNNSTTNVMSFNQSSTTSPNGAGQAIMNFPNNNSNFNIGVNAVDSFGGGYTPENSSTAASSDSFGAQVSPVSDLTDQQYNNYGAATTTTNSTTAANNTLVPVSHNPSPDQYGYFQACHDQQLNGYKPDQSTLTSAHSSVNQSFGFQGLVMDYHQPMDHHHHQTSSSWNMDGLDQSDMGLWNGVDDIWFLQQQLNNSI